MEIKLRRIERRVESKGGGRDRGIHPAGGEEEKVPPILNNLSLPLQYFCWCLNRERKICVCECVFVNRHLFIGFKLYAMKASLRQDVLFGCQKEKLKKKYLPPKRVSRCLFLLILSVRLLMVNDNCQFCVLEPDFTGERDY